MSPRVPAGGLARRLLIILWGMLKSNTPFREPKATKRKETPKEEAPGAAAPAMV